MTGSGAGLGLAGAWRTMGGGGAGGGRGGLVSSDMQQGRQGMRKRRRARKEAMAMVTYTSSPDVVMYFWKDGTVGSGRTKAAYVEKLLMAAIATRLLLFLRKPVGPRGFHSVPLSLWTTSHLLLAMMSLIFSSTVFPSCLRIASATSERRVTPKSPMMSGYLSGKAVSSSMVRSTSLASWKPDCSTRMILPSLPLEPDGSMVPGVAPSSSVTMMGTPAVPPMPRAPTDPRSICTPEPPLVVIVASPDVVSTTCALTASA
mmetsp:Transcript_33855/g.83184  ORF Transcript_33855/g.83184 Transcript_33855/m.83184 type:complete len:259 (+) Transcript_33855:1606-2382(+)